MMHAAVWHGAKDIRLEPRRRPEPGPGFVLLRPRRVGICGSDLHYYEHGYCAAFVPDRPFVLGHELTAEVAALGEGVTRVREGERVTVNPARACGFCDYCKGGRPNLCGQTLMLGSASTTPPTDGAMAEFVCVRADQCHALPPDLDDGLGAMMEPLAVALHAVKRAGAVSGRRVLVTGGGTIGLLVALTARAFGASPVVVTDVVPARRARALALGADAALDPSAGDLHDQVRALVGAGFDVILEASGARPALRQAFDLVRAGGTIVQIGTLGTEDVPLPANQIMVREINFVGSMRYGNVFDEAIRLVASGRLDVRPFISAVLPLADCGRAMELAGDKANVLKVQLVVDTTP
ncbi:MAG: alcohol dehydrogenase catalytic domain-containing protein [Verrucomicrobia bacterium]|nr:alcohol dehydrogenase catalytic domain-containing protein [Verrucomicrobiota bacterium]